MPPRDSRTVSDLAKELERAERRSARKIRVKRKANPKNAPHSDDPRGRAQLAKKAARESERERKRATVFAAPRSIFLPDELVGEKSKKPKQPKAFLSEPRKLQDDFDLARYRQRLALGVDADAKHFARAEKNITDVVPEPHQDRGYFDKHYGWVEPVGRALAEGAEGALRAIDTAISPQIDVQGTRLSSRTGRSTAEGMTEFAAEAFVGTEIPKALRGEDFDLKTAIAEAAILPLGPKGTTLITRSLRAARGLVKAGQATKAGEGVRVAFETAARESSQPIRPVAKAGRVVRLTRGKRGARRTFKVAKPDSPGEFAVADVAAARPRTGRVLERGFDAIRPVTSKLPGIKDETQKFAEATQRRIAFDQKIDMLPGVRLRALSLKPAEQYAVLSNRIGVDPALARDYHLVRAAQTDDPLERSAHRIQASYFEAAEKLKYVVQTGDDVALSPDAPAQIHLADRLMAESAETREGILTELGLVDEATMRERVQAHGAIYKGAEYDPDVLSVRPGFTDQLSDEHRATLTAAFGDDESRWADELIEYASGERAVAPEAEDALRETLSLFDSDTLLAAKYLPRDVADVFDHLAFMKQVQKGGLVGAEHAAGKSYAPLERGFPTSLRHPLASTRNYIRSMTGLFNPRKGSPIGKGFVDPSTKKAFKGVLIAHGWFKADVAKASADALAKAVRLSSVAKAREALLEIASAVPSRADDIPIKRNPSLDAPKATKRYWEVYEEMGSELAVSKFALKDLERASGDVFENLSRQVSPDLIDGLTPQMVAHEILTGVREPIPNILWVPAKAVYEGDLFSNARAYFGRDTTWGQLEGVGWGVDIVQDFMKLSILQANPAYIPMNLLGNLALNLMHQGPFALINLPRAALLSREMGPDLAASVDSLMGRGITQIAETSTLLTHPSRFFADYAGRVVDLVPRRSAFLHEAWAMGYRSADDIAHLLTNPELRDDLYHVTEKANDAIIDYERLSPLERKIMTRVFFVYPWIKGATRFTYRFPAEHPVQAMAVAYAYQQQQQAADEQLGDRPWYSDLLIPIGTTERFGTEYPRTLNPKQLIPFSTPFEFAEALSTLVTGDDDYQAALETLQPLYPALVASLTGYDSFSHREVGRGVGTFLDQASQVPIRTAFENLGRTDLEDAASNRLYPRNERDEIIKTVLGSLAPSPYNPEKGQHYAKGKRGQTPEQKAREKAKQIAGTYDPSLEPKVQLALSTKVQYEYAKDEARKRLKTDDLSAVQLTEVLLDVALEHIPDIDRGYVMSQLDAATAGEVRGALESELGWTILDAATTVANRRERAEEGKSETVSSG